MEEKKKNNNNNKKDIVKNWPSSECPPQYRCFNCKNFMTEPVFKFVDETAWRKTSIYLCEVCLDFFGGEKNEK